ncbi:MAG: ribonuclease P protein component [Candidatus Nomurabacteria bacterium]|jgi:ribonuclease P protein component|nr:ribonuclease P protein component [Candidatus Nomurabacteria bacterium]
MISKKYRFHGYGSLNYLHRNGAAVRGKGMAAKFAPNVRRDLPRFAVVVSKKVLKSAVKRNRLRRRIFEIVRHYIRPDSPSIDVMITVFTPELLDVEHQKLKTDVEALLKLSGL